MVLKLDYFSNDSESRFGEGVKLQGTQTSEIKEPLFCKEAKLHGAQALQPLKITNVQGSQTEMVHLYCAAKTKKLQGTQTRVHGWLLTRF